MCRVPLQTLLSQRYSLSQQQVRAKVEHSIGSFSDALGREYMLVMQESTLARVSELDPCNMFFL
jgi:hypothetical protein